jgi:branched-chain amino acid transport system ATP-binding protein
VCVISPALSLCDVRKTFDAAEVIRGVNLDVAAHECHAVIGPNGAGKSTLFNLISGLLLPDSGSIALKGHDITGMPPWLINRGGLSRSFQVTNIFHRMSVWENIRAGVLWSAGERYAFWRDSGSEAAVGARTERVLVDFDLAHRHDVPAGVLTYAEQRALEIAITVAGGADVILLDEPTAGMSRAETDRMLALIRRISEGRTLIIVEHDMSVVFGLADRISVLVYGEIIASGTPTDIRRDTKVREAYLGQEAP